MDNLNQLNKAAWNAYQEDYMKFHLMAFENYYESFMNGGSSWLDDFLITMPGDVKGLKLLVIPCGVDCVQAFSWHNLGAHVTACDISPKAIEIASANAAKMNLSLDFIVDDMQTLESVGDDEFDIIFAMYPCWVQDFNEACRNWHRVLKPGGKLLLNAPHPIMDCIEANENGLIVNEDYNNFVTEIDDNFGGTPLADRFGGWSVDLPSVCNFYRISDILNAISDAGFIIKKTHESKNETQSNIYLSKLPEDFTVLAVK